MRPVTPVSYPRIQNAELSKSQKRAREEPTPDNAAKMAEILEYASTCILPTTFIDLPLVAKREYNHDSTIYTFGLPEGKSLSLPVCACVLLKAPGRGRGPNGKDDLDGSDAIRPYTPMSDNSMLGQFELCVKRYDGGSVSQWLYGLELGAKVGFKHISFNIKAPYPFDGKKSITLLCAGTGLAPMYQVCPSPIAATISTSSPLGARPGTTPARSDLPAPRLWQALWKLLGTPGDKRQVVLLYGNKSVEDILLKVELSAWSKQAAGNPHPSLTLASP